MFHGTLQKRIVFIFLSLLLVIQAVTFLLIHSGIDRNARQALDASLDQGAQVFKRVLEQNADHLLQTTQVLAQDYGFRSAIASDDRDTIASALSNHGERVGASIAVFTDAQFNVKAALGSDRADLVPRLQHVARGAWDGSDAVRSAHVIILDGQPYQVVAVPVRAPLTIGWVFMGFRIGPELLNDARKLAGVQVALLVRPRGGDWRPTLSTLSLASGQSLVNYANQQPSTPLPDRDDGRKPHAIEAVDVNGASYVACAMNLAPRGDEQAMAVLMKSVDEAVAPYHHLEASIVVLAAIGTVLFALGSTATARRITTPLRVLTQSARKLGQGDYTAHIPPQGNDEIGELAQAFESMRTTVQERESQIKRLAFNDALTGLPNRLGFAEMAQAATAHRPGGERPFAIIKMDIDRFRLVNDSLGYELGDQLLQQVSRNLKALKRTTSDILARVGGNEFALLLSPCDRLEAERVCAQTHAMLDQPLLIADNRIDVRVGVGVALFPEHAGDADTLLRYSELALHQSKSRQVPTVFFEDGLNVRGEHSLSQLGEMRAALELGQMRLFVQPQVNLADGVVKGAEGLLRWIHPERGMIPPMDFIPFAEQTGFVRQLTSWIIREGARVVRDWQDRGHPLVLSLNLSARDLADADLIGKIDAAFAEFGVCGASFCLEITESTIMDDPQRALQTLERLHERGIRLAIDDFGTGYSSLAYLKRLPVDELKIDKSFVMNMERDLQDAKIVRSTIDLAHNLGLQVVSEGIESDHSWQLLQALNCDIAQGYWIAKPMPLADFESWLSRWRQPEVGTWVMPSTWSDLVS